MTHHQTHHRHAGVVGDVHFEGDCVVRVGERTIRAHADLIGGRDRHSVGGEIWEGPRWWRGRIDWPREDAEPLDRGRIHVEIEEARSAPALIEPGASVPEHSSAILGIGPPPFDVP